MHAYAVWIYDIQVFFLKGLSFQSSKEEREAYKYNQA